MKTRKLTKNDKEQLFKMLLPKIESSMFMLSNLEQGGFDYQGSFPQAEYYGVVSDSRIERKVLSLHVNVVGNDCDMYMLGEPGMGRSKINYRFGIGPSKGDDLNHGYSHINQTSRAHNAKRKEALDQKVLANFNLLKPVTHMN